MMTRPSAVALLSLVCQIALIFQSVASATPDDEVATPDNDVATPDDGEKQVNVTGRARIGNFRDGCPEVIAIHENENDQHQDYHRDKLNENVYVKTDGEGSDLVYMEGKWCLDKTDIQGRDVVMKKNSPNQDQTSNEKCPKDFSNWNMCSNVYVCEVSIEVDTKFGENIAPLNPEKGFELGMEWPPFILIIMWTTLFFMKLMETCR